jgi:hypothetical protein
MAPVSRLMLITVGIGQLLDDGFVLAAVHVLLTGMLVVSLFAPLLARRLGQQGGLNAKAKVIRGERSMTILYVAYGVGTVALTLAVQVGEVVKGHKVALILFDYAVLSYLFFFNSWFRNRLLGLLGRVYED